VDLLGQDPGGEALKKGLGADRSLLDPRTLGCERAEPGLFGSVGFPAMHRAALTIGRVGLSLFQGLSFGSEKKNTGPVYGRAG
jgi:hypothetical protein